MAVLSKILYGIGNRRLEALCVLFTRDGYGPNNNGGIYFDTGPDTPWGKKFSFDKTQVQDYIIDAALMWVQEYRIDGLRVDSGHNMPDWLLKKITKAVKTVSNGKTFMTCEVCENLPGL
jgi:1,4-alpha-glucan branching enzyme